MIEGISFYIHLFITIWLTGLIWYVQIVHYPLYKLVSQEDWLEYEKAHVRRTKWVTFYPMLVEALTGVLTLYMWYSKNMAIEILLLMGINGILALSTWITTFTIQYPLHMQLCQAYNLVYIQRLINSNWLRVFIWTLRSILVIILWIMIQQ